METKGSFPHPLPNMLPQDPSDTVLVQSQASQILAEGQPQRALELAEGELASAREARETDQKWGSLVVHLLEIKATACIQLGDLDEAEAALREALLLQHASGGEPILAAKLETQLATVLDQSGRSDEMVAQHEKAVAALESLETPDKVTAAELRNNLALEYKRTGRLALAEQHYLQALEVIEKTFGKENETVASIYNNLGSLYYTAGFPDQAKDVFDQALSIRMKLLGTDHPDVAQSLCNLATVHHELGNNVESLDCYQKSLRILEAHLPEKHNSYIATGEDYLAVLGSLSEDDKAAEFQAHMQKLLA